MNKKEEIIGFIEKQLSQNLAEEYGKALRKKHADFCSKNLFVIIREHEDGIKEDIKTRAIEIYKSDRTSEQDQIKNHDAEFVEKVLNAPAYKIYLAGLNTAIESYFKESYPNDSDQAFENLFALFKTGKSKFDLQTKEIILALKWDNVPLIRDRAEQYNLRPFHNIKNCLNKHFWEVFNSAFEENFNAYLAGKDDNKFIEHFNQFSRKYIGLFEIKFSLSEEAKRIILLNKIELNLWATLGTKQVTLWLENIEFKAKSGCILVDDTFWVVTKTDKYDFAEGYQTIPKNYRFGDVVSAHKNRIEKSNIEFPLGLHSEVTKKSENDAITVLSHEFELDINQPFSKVKIDGRQKWRQTLIRRNNHQDDFQYLHFPFNLKKNTPDEVLGFVRFDYRSKEYLPISYWKRNGENREVRLHVPFWDGKKSPLFNQNLIYEHKNADIILTSWLQLAAIYQEKFDYRFIFTSWFGGAENLQNVGFLDLKNRYVYYLIKKSSDENLNIEEYRTALEVLKLLKEVKTTKLNFIEFEIGSVFNESALPKINCKNVELNTSEEFEKKAKQILGLFEVEDDSLEKIPVIKVSPKKLSDDKNPRKSRKFLLAPILHENSISIFFSKTSIGKTWLSLSLAFCASVGGRIFYTWNASKPRKVLYCDFEMDPDSFISRLKKIQKMDFGVSKAQTKKCRENFQYILKEDKLFKLPLATIRSEIFKYVKSEKISLIIIDNLSAATKHNDTAGAWESINLWLTELQKIGCASLIVHHTNKKNEQRGTSAKTNTTDNSIRLEEIKNKPIGSDLAFSINIDKGRDLFGFSKTPLEVALFTKSAKPMWQIIPEKTPEAISALEDEILQDLISRNNTIDEIQDYLGWQRIEVIKRKEKLKIKRHYEFKDKVLKNKKK